MKSLWSVPLLVLLASSALSCSDSTRPIDEHSLVLAYSVQGGLHCGIVLSSLTGQTRDVERSCGFRVAWSPDGTRLAFNRPGGEAAPPTLWIVNADGTGEVEVAGGRGLAAPDWSPDGTRLAALRVGSGNVVVLHPDGTARVELFSQGLVNFDRVSWSPDGTELLLANRDTLWAVNASTDVARVVAVPGLAQVSGARWSPDGSRISFNARTGPAPRFGVYVMNADATHLQLLAESFEVSGAPWSPDGSQVVYSASENGTLFDVFVAPSDGSGPPVNVTHNSGNEASLAPDWARTR